MTAGSAAFVGAGTAWAVALVAGGTLCIEAAGNPMPIASITDDTHGTASVKWTGASGTYSYSIALENANAAAMVNVNTTLSRVLVSLSLAGIHPDSSGTLTQRNALTLNNTNDGYLFLRAEIGVEFAFYRWNGNTLAWEGPYIWTGLAGSASVVGTSTTSLAIATGAKTFTVVESARGWGAGARLRASSNANAANFMEGTVTSYSANTLVMNIDLIGGSGTKTDWTINLVGQPGAVTSVNGATGAVFIEAVTHAATSKATPVDADELPLVDSAASNILKKLTWANLKATLLAAATFTTSLTGPLLVGGTGTGSSLTLQSTSGVGATDFIRFMVGNNGATEAARFDTSGHFVLGSTTSQATIAGGQPPFQVHSLGPFTSTFYTWANAPAGPIFTYAKSRGATVGAHTIVQSGDTLGIMIGAGSDGTQFISAGEIRFLSDGTPGTNDMPGRIAFSVTPDGTAAVVEALRISNNGALAHRNNAQTIFDQNSHLGLRQYAAGSLPAQSAGFFIQSSDVLGGELASDGVQWISPGMLVKNAVTANTTISVPAGWYIADIVFANTTANAVTGGVKIGTTSGATDVVAAQAIAGSAIGKVPDASILKTLFSRTAAQTLFIQTVTSWNGASVELSFKLRKAF
ncbi:hypothetical protein [Mesorhizobium loti]|uniref:hypothetical protein n=1 Tax=Rhizobium loti TaxID=381 RepID=UPI0003FC7B02|nr:hypothetical protein [Mesorhizobium loti]